MDSSETALEVTGDWTLVRQPWYLNLAKKEFRPKEPLTEGESLLRNSQR